MLKQIQKTMINTAFMFLVGQVGAVKDTKVYTYTVGSLAGNIMAQFSTPQDDGYYPVSALWRAIYNADCPDNATSMSIIPAGTTDVLDPSGLLPKKNAEYTCILTAEPDRKEIIEKVKAFCQTCEITKDLAHYIKKPIEYQWLSQRFRGDRTIFLKAINGTNAIKITFTNSFIIIWTMRGLRNYDTHHMVSYKDTNDTDYLEFNAMLQRIYDSLPPM